MSAEAKDKKSAETRSCCIDEYDNVFEVTQPLSSGGQGIVYRLTDADLALKRPARDGVVLEDVRFNDEFKKVRLLALPDRVQVTTPLSTLKGAPGYVMRLLNGMRPLTLFQLKPEDEKAFEGKPLPAWLAGFDDDRKRRGGYVYLHYAKTGGAKRRHLTLAKTAAILARLHANGLVYGDISLNNVFVGEGADPAVWLIDADNLRLERARGGGGVYTPGLGAPEVVTGKDDSRPRSDCWAFAVMAYKLLRLAHPFLGAKVSGESGEEEDWANVPLGGAPGMTAEDMAYSGMFPFVDDENDRSNALPKNVMTIPRDWLFTTQLKRLFQETLGAGRTDASRRPAIGFWAMECARAADLMITCPNCGMTYFPESVKLCPYCDSDNSPYVLIKTSRWRLLASEKDVTDGTLGLPHRMFHPFSLRQFDEIERYCESDVTLSLDFGRRISAAQRGSVLPEGIEVSFSEGLT